MTKNSWLAVGVIAVLLIILFVVLEITGNNDATESINLEVNEEDMLSEEEMDLETSDSELTEEENQETSENTQIDVGAEVEVNTES